MTKDREYIEKLIGLFLELNDNLVIIRNHIGQSFEHYSENIAKNQPKQLFEKELNEGLREIMFSAVSLNKNQEEVNKEIDNLIKSLEKKHKIKLKDFLDSINEKIVDESKIGVEIKSLFDKVNFYKKSIDLIFKNGLENAISAFETFLSEIIKLRFLQYPGTLDEKKITLKEICGVSRIKDVAPLVAQNEADEIMQKSVIDFMQYIGSNFNIDMLYFESNKTLFLEMFYRRNIYVHNRGIVNKTYLELSKNPFNLLKGSLASIDIEYLYSACSMLLLCAADIVTSIISKLKVSKNSYDEKENKLSAIAFYCYLKTNQWNFALEFYEILIRNNNIKQDMKDMYKLNILLCKKEMKQISVDDIKKIKWKNKRPFLLQGYYALTEEFDKMIEIIADNKSNLKESVTVDNILQWPIYRSFRKHEEKLKLLISKLN